MKKFVSMAIALVMVLSLTVCVFADDEVIWTEDTMFFSASNWSYYELENDGFLDALQTEGAVLTITRSAESGVGTWVEGEDGDYENFCIIDSWYSGYVWLGTAGHTSADEPDKGILDCLSDDGLVVTYDANAVYEAYVEAGCTNGGSPAVIICTSAADVYKVTNVSVIVPETPIATATESEEAEASSDVEETTEAAESTETSTASSPDTGVALALVPMAIAGIAVVSSKRR